MKKKKGKRKMEVKNLSNHNNKKTQPDSYGYVLLERE